jgi:hypothetical protein
LLDRKPSPLTTAAARILNSAFLPLLPIEQNSIFSDYIKWFSIKPILFERNLILFSIIMVSLNSKKTLYLRHESKEDLFSSFFFLLFWLKNKNNNFCHFFHLLDSADRTVTRKFTLLINLLLLLVFVAQILIYSVLKHFLCVLIKLSKVLSRNKTISINHSWDDLS